MTKGARIFGIIVGVIIILIGFVIQGSYTTAGVYDGPDVGKPIKFGADFYTEMYAVTRDVGDAVNYAQAKLTSTMIDSNRSVCGAIGWLIVVIGLVDIAYFVSKQTLEDGAPMIAYNAAPVAAASQVPAAAPAPAASAPSTWVCTCGKMHQDYESACSCGVTKREAKAAQSAAQPAEKPAAQHLFQEKAGVPEFSAKVSTWTCTCGKVHQDYESSCSCGVTKREAKAAQKV